MMNSAILGSLAKLRDAFIGIVRDSFSFRIFTAVSSYLKNAARKSKIVGFFLNPIDEKDNGSFRKWSRVLAQKLSEAFAKPGRFAGNAIRKSRFTGILFDFYSNILFIPFGNFGILAATSGTIYILLTGILSKIGPRSVLAAAILIPGGIAVFFIKSSLYEMINGSFFSSIIAGRKDILTKLGVSDSRKEKNHYPLMLILGILIGVLPVLLPTFYALTGITAIIAVPLILIWPVLGLLALALTIAFIPTMAAAGLIILTWGSVIMNCSLGRMSLKGVLEKGKPILLFIIIILSGGVLSFAIADSIRIALIYSVFISSVYLFLALAKNRAILSAIMTLFGAAAFLTAVYGLYQYLTGNIQVGWIDSEMFSGIIRIYSTFENPNVYGEYLLFMIPLAVMFFFVSKRFIYKLFWMGAGALMVIAMVLTMSRGCWIGFAAGMFIYFLIADRRYLWLFFGAIVVLPFVLPQSVMFRLLSIGNLEDSSSLYRLFIWLGTFRMLGDYWLTGIGLGTKAFSGIYSAYAYNGILAPHSHNMYLNILSERGIAGFLLLGWITLKSMRYSISNAISKKGFGRHAGAAIAAAFTGILVQGVFDNVFYNYRVFLIFWVFVALAFSYHIISTDEREQVNG